ncbi:Loki-CTERM sorting domain-containing protein [Geobacillus icigianus]|nr:Loki-CTERM sorting domain-containing protein [Geobacillus icigianus]
MPELKWSYGYPLALLLIATVAALIALYFKRKGWGDGNERKIRVFRKKMGICPAIWAGGRI